MKGRWNLWLPIGMMIVFAITCWPPFMPDSLKNFSAAYALAFCAGVYFPGKMRWVLPLVTLLVLDVGLNIYYGQTAYGKTELISVYTIAKLAAYAGVIWLGTRFSRKTSWFKLVGGGLVGALIFYIVTNTASWMFDPGYAKTLSGWLQALTTGLPGWSPPTWVFLKNTLISGGLFTGLFAGVMKGSEAAEEVEEKEPAEERGDEAIPEEA